MAALVEAKDQARSTARHRGVQVIMIRFANVALWALPLLLIGHPNLASIGEPAEDPVQGGAGAAKLEPDSAFEGTWELIPERPEADPVVSPRRIVVQLNHRKGRFWQDSTNDPRTQLVIEYRRLPGIPHHRIFRSRIRDRGMSHTTLPGDEKGLYKLEGDTLTTTWNGYAAPPDFKPGPGRVIEIYRRVRQPEEAAALRGSWTLTSRTRDGRPEAPGRQTLTIDAKDGWVERQGDSTTRLKAIRSEGIPWPAVRLEGPPAAKGERSVRRGNYRLDRDKGKLTLRFGGGPLDDMEPGPGRVVEVYRRDP